MKCPECNGYGYEGYSVEECVLCHGKGCVGPLTNDEWRKTCSAEEFAEFLAFTILGKCPDEEKVQYWLEWLKEKHNE